MNVQRYPLSWPENQPKPALRFRARFTGTSTSEHGRRTRPHTIEESRSFLFQELDRLKATDSILSSNLRTRNDGMPVSGQSEPADPSVAVYFMLSGRKTVLACGKWDRAADNIWAIAKHIESLRGQERWGCGTTEQAFRGYLAIPEKTSGKGWWDVLEIPYESSAEKIKEAYQYLARIYHAGGTNPNEEKMIELNLAKEAADKHIDGKR